MKILIKQGYVLDPASKREGIYDILIDGDRIVKVDKVITAEADQIIDASDCYVMPGFIDMHVHLREPGYEYKETIKTGTMAAARGGFTTVVVMPNTKPAIDSPKMVTYLIDKAKEEAVVHVIPVAAITKEQLGTELAPIKDMVKAGALAISEDGKSVMETALYREAMRQAKEADVPVLSHCEDRSLVGKGVMNEGAKSKELGLAGISNAVEDVIVARDIFMAKEVGAKLHLCHCSTSDSVVMVELAKKQGLPVTAEVCPHHFIMSDDQILSDHGNYKMNPPLRSKQDVEALKDGLKNNIMDVIATDHAPHGEEEKNQSIAKAPFGIVGLETAFSLTLTELVEQGYLTPMQMVEKLSYNPAKILGLDKGSLLEGKIADIVIANPKEQYKINTAEFASKGKNTPFEGKKVSGRIKTTIVDGVIVFEDK